MALSFLLLAAVVGLRVRVLDPSGAAVPKAAVTLQCAPMRPHKAVTGSNGEAAFPVADASACTLLVEARGFEPHTEREMAPDASGLFTVRLTLARREEKVTVGDDTRESLARERSFSQVLTPEEIASLPDDPEEMENELSGARAGARCCASTASAAAACRPRARSARSGSRPIASPPNTTRAAIPASRS